MKKIMLSMLLLAVVFTLAAKPVKKILDDGGSGPYKAEAVSDPSLPGYVVYRPADVQAAAQAGGALPLMVFANGGCNDTSLPHERMLNDIASHGYLVVALGEMQDSITDRELHKSPNEDMIRAIDWAETQNRLPGSPYAGAIALDRIALGGQSCGGAQVLANCADPRVKTCIMFNSGMGDIKMTGASAESLKNLHCPILYIIGGVGDIAYRNAVADYERIDKVPVAFANQLRVGHGGTFHEPFGGSFAPMSRAWLDLWLKGKSENRSIFVDNNLAGFPDYTMRAKNFPEVNEPFAIKEMTLTMRDGKKLWGRAYIPVAGDTRKPIVVMAHGYNSSHHEPQAYAESLAMNGVASFIFDFCGGSNHSLSDGVTTEMTIFTEKENVEDITDAVKSWDFVDPDRVALLGCSQGGLVSAITAAANPDMFKALVLVYPALTIPHTAPMMLNRFDADGGRPQDVMGMKLGRVYYEKINGLDVFGTVGAYKKPVFIVYGDKDMIVAGGVEEGVSSYDKAEVLVIEGGNHGFSDYLHHAQATGGIVDFILRNL